MTKEEEIDSLLKNLQEETPNCGGQYHFTKIDLPEGYSLKEKLQKFSA